MAWLALTMALPFAASQAQTFLPVPLNISNTGHAVVPSIAVGPSGEIDVVWLDAGAILFRRSVDGGQNVFVDAMTVAKTNLPLGCGLADRPAANRRQFRRSLRGLGRGERGGRRRHFFQQRRERRDELAFAR